MLRHCNAEPHSLARGVMFGRKGKASSKKRLIKSPPANNGKPASHLPGKVGYRCIKCPTFGKLNAFVSVQSMAVVFKGAGRWLVYF